MTIALHDDSPPTATIERTFRAPVERVWAMWTTKEGLEAWYWPAPLALRARIDRGRSQSRWSAFSLATGLLFFAAFASIASGSKQHWIVPAFTAAVLLAWTWLTTVAIHLRDTA